MTVRRTTVQLTVATYIAIFFTTPIALAHPSVASTKPVSIYSIVQSINTERSRAGEASFTVNNDLSAIANDRLEDMLTKGYFGHDYAQTGTVVEFADKKRLNYAYIGENLALGYDDPENLVSAWMSSDDHRKNLLNANYVSLGLAMSETSDGLLIVAVFSDATDSLTSLTLTENQASFIRRTTVNDWSDLPLKISQFLQLQK